MYYKNMFSYQKKPKNSNIYSIYIYYIRIYDINT